MPGVFEASHQNLLDLLDGRDWFLSLVLLVAFYNSAPMGLKHRCRLYPGLTLGATNVPPLWGSFLWHRIKICWMGGIGKFE